MAGPNEKKNGGGGVTASSSKNMDVAAATGLTRHQFQVQV